MVGIELPENFRRPFFAQSVADYWRRWHITLGGWFRSYLLYPLTTSRAGIAMGKRASALLGKRTGRVLPGALATLLVFLLIGLWHAANWNALIYGGYFGIIMAASTCRSTPWSIMSWEPSKISSAGWNMSRTVPGSSASWAFSSRAASRSMAVWKSWPQA